MLRFLDAGESHGKCLVAIIEGFPSNVEINIENVNYQLKRRQRGYGRGERMKIEHDEVEVLSGIRGGRTTGAPICISIKNRDYQNWMEIMDCKNKYEDKIIIPRPGHADLNGVLKYNLEDIRNVIERASARETAIRVAVGGISMELLKKFGVKIISRVKSIGRVCDYSNPDLSSIDAINRIESSPVGCYDLDIEKEMIKEIDEAKANGETLGGESEIVAFGVPIGLGSYVSYDRRMEYNIAGALMSIQGVKAVEIGYGINASSLCGSEVMDEIIYKDGVYKRNTNYAGGIEGGITNGMPVVVKAYMKPIPTIRKTINTVDLKGNKVTSRYERSDTCVVPALSVIAEGVLGYELTKAFLNKFPGDSIDELANSYEFYMKRVSRG